MNRGAFAVAYAATKKEVTIAHDPYPSPPHNTTHAHTRTRTRDTRTWRHALFFVCQTGEEYAVKAIHRSIIKTTNLQREISIMQKVPTTRMHTHTHTHTPCTIVSYVSCCSIAQFTRLHVSLSFIISPRFSPFSLVSLFVLLPVLSLFCVK